MFSPRRSLTDVHAWRERGPHRAVQTLHDRLRAGGGSVLGGVRALELLGTRPDQRVAGVLARGCGTFGELRAGCVVLADGGFHADPALRREHIGRFADRIALRGSPMSTGDALRMAVQIGAQLTNTRFFYGHLLHRDALRNDRLWPMPLLDELLEAGVVVSTTGHRLADETAGGIAVTNQLARVHDPRDGWLVLDDRAWRAARPPREWPCTGGEPGS